MVAKSEDQARRFFRLYNKEKLRKVNCPQNFNPSSSELAKLVDIAIDNKWLSESSVLYALLTDTLKSIKLQEEQFARHGN